MTAPSPIANPSVFVIEPERGRLRLGIGEVWAYRELLGVFVWRNIKVRYRQTALGAVWAVLPPLIMTAVFTLFFRRVREFQSVVPYPVFALCGLVVWTFFSQAVTGAANSIVQYAPMITKVYFPRVLLPVAHVLAAVLDLAIGLVLLLILVLIFHPHFGSAIFMLPFFIVLLLAVTTAVVLWVSALNALYRDFQYVVPFAIQILFFSTPIVYPSSLVTGKWHGAAALNPLVAVIDGFRWSITGMSSPSQWSVAAAIAVAVAALGSGIIFFRRVEKTFVDVI